MLSNQRPRAVIGIVALLALAIGTLAIDAGSARAETSPAGSSVVRSDDFNSASLDSNLWSVVDPRGGGSVSIQGAGSGDAHLALSIPGGADHELWGSNDSLRVLQSVADQDFETVVRFDSQPSSQYQMQGLLVQADADNWLRLEIMGKSGSMYAYGAVTTNGSTSTLFYKRIPVSASSSLRVTRSGSSWSVATAGTDPTTFATQANFTWDKAVTAVGPYVGNASNNGSSAPAYTALVDYIFDTSAPITPEDGATTPVTQHTLATNVVGSGTVSPASGTYNAGTNVTLTAQPASGWQFSGWSGDITGTTNPTTITVDTDKNITATFVATTPVTQHTLATNVVGSGTVSPASGTYNAGTNVTLTAQPASGWQFSGWSGDITGTTNPTTITVDTDKNITATFVATPPPDPGSSVVRSDDFNSASLDSNLWSVVDPRGGGSVSIQGAGSGDAHLALSIPGGADHELWGSNDSLRVLQSVADQDFETVVRFDSQPSSQYQMQGLLVQADADNWLRLEIMGKSGSMYAYGAVTTNGSTSTLFYKRIPVSASSSLRVTRSGSSWSVATAGTDPTTFATQANFTWDKAVTAVGPYVGNASNNGSSAPAYTALVDYIFDTSAPITPEDGATTPVTQHTLATNVVGSGTVSPASGTYNAGTNVTLTAQPASGWQFSGWSGDITGTTNPTTITLDTDKNITATFVATTPVTQHTLATNVVGSGTVSPASGTYNAGTNVTLTAQPASGWQFSGWSGDITGTTNPTTITLDTDKNITATFVAIPPPDPGSSVVRSDDFNSASLDSNLWSVVDPRGGGSVSIQGAGSGDAHLALSIPGGADHELWGSNDSLRVLQSVADQDFETVVRFDSQPSSQYQMQGLLVQADADNWLRLEIMGKSGSMYAYGAVTTNGSTSTLFYKRIPVSASSSLRVTRSGSSWSVATTGTDPTTFATQANFTWDKAVTAVGPYVGNASNNGSSAPAYTALVDYIFDTSAPITPEDGATTPVTQHTLATNVVGSGTVSPASGTYNAGTNVTLTAQPASGWQFSGWSGDITGTTNPTTITLDTDKNITATFVATTDTTPPVISGVNAAWNGTAVLVGWTTDEPSTGAVDHGTSTAYGSVADAGAAATSHSVSLSGYGPGEVVHYRIRAVDVAGNPSQSTDRTFVVPGDSGTAFDLWYGSEETFGALGVPQKWVNVLGNVQDPDGISQLWYRLNGGDWSWLETGPDRRRLLSPGDFNVEIDRALLQAGANLVEIRAVDGTGATSTTEVTVNWVPGNTWAKPYNTNWSTAGSVTDRAQPVDGNWQLVPGGVRAADVGYDRVLAIGDVSWTNYDVRTTATVHGINEAAWNDPYSGAPSLSFGLGWQGHTPRGDGAQPNWYYWPTGALAGYDWLTPTSGRLFMQGNLGYPTSFDSGFNLEIGTTYNFRFQVQTEAGGIRYRMKTWRIGTAEPTTWNVNVLDSDGPTSGSFLLTPHHVDATFGDVVVTPIS